MQLNVQYIIYIHKHKGDEMREVTRSYITRLSFFWLQDRMVRCPVIDSKRTFLESEKELLRRNLRRILCNTEMHEKEKGKKKRKTKKQKRKKGKLILLRDNWRISRRVRFKPNGILRKLVYTYTLQMLDLRKLSWHARSMHFRKKEQTFYAQDETIVSALKRLHKSLRIIILIIICLRLFLISMKLLWKILPNCLDNSDDIMNNYLYICLVE